MTAPLNPPAFPAVYPDPVHSGISKREYFAAAALTGLLASGQWHNCGSGFGEHIAMQAGEIADAMLVFGKGE